MLPVLGENCSLATQEESSAPLPMILIPFWLLSKSVYWFCLRLIKSLLGPSEKKFSFRPWPQCNYLVTLNRMFPTHINYLLSHPDQTCSPVRALRRTLMKASLFTDIKETEENAEFIWDSTLDRRRRVLFLLNIQRYGKEDEIEFPNETWSCRIGGTKWTWFTVIGCRARTDWQNLLFSPIGGVH